MNPYIRIDYFARDTCGLTLATTDAPDWPQEAASASRCRFRPIPSFGNVTCRRPSSGELWSANLAMGRRLHAMLGCSTAQRSVEWLADKPSAPRRYDRLGSQLVTSWLSRRGSPFPSMPFPSGRKVPPKKDLRSAHA